MNFVNDLIVSICFKIQASSPNSQEIQIDATTLKNIAQRFDLNQSEHSSTFIESKTATLKKQNVETAETEFYPFESMLDDFESGNAHRKCS